jgi:hypothetical protein
VFFFLLCLLKLGFFGTGTGDDISAFLSFFLAFGDVQGWSRNHKYTTQTEQDGRRLEAAGKGAQQIMPNMAQPFPRQRLAATHRHHSKRARPHPLSFVEEHNESGWSWLEGKKKQMGGRNTPCETKKRNSQGLHGCLQ